MKKHLSHIFLLLSFLFLCNINVMAQSHIVKGVVKDNVINEPLIGVNVVVKGTTNGVTTDIDGMYSIEVPNAKSELQFSYMGYNNVTIAVNGKKVINVNMDQTTQDLEEVIVVGYGIQKKESVIGSIASINNKSLVSLPVTNITQSLAGKLSGVQVVQSSGEVGKDEAAIYVRGLATYGDATPLIVVDGIVRQSFAQIDPNEIESINILKDASATAVYGIKGANGVIVVTTKRGEEGKPQVSFSAQVAVTQPTRIPQPLNSYKASVLQNLHMSGDYSNPTYSNLDILKYMTGSSPFTHPDTDWVDEIMKDHSQQQQYNLNVSGGTKMLKYFVSGGYMSQDGFYKNDPYTNFTRYNFRSNFDINITNNFSASINVGSRIEERNNPYETMWSSWNVYRAAFATSGRKYTVYNPDGSWSGQTNILSSLKNSGQAKETKSVLELGVNLKYKLDAIVPGLSARAQMAYDHEGNNRRVWTQSAATYEYNLIKDTYLQYGEDRPLAWNWEDGTFFKKLYLEAGFEYNKTFGANTFGGLLLVNRNLRTVNTDFEYADQGMVGRLTYDYNKKYFAEFNIGINGSENFPEKGRYGTFPAFALGWLLSNEEFFANSSLSNIITSFKLRASLGWVGNDKLSIGNNPQRFLYLQQYYYGGGANFGTGDNYYEGIIQDKIANSNVTWEVARKQNLGFESDFFNGLFGLNAEVFYERRSNILTDISGIMPGYVGASFMPANVGIVDNKGFEIELRHSKDIGKDFNYFIRGNFSFNRNKVVKKADPEGLLAYQKEEGYPIGTPLLYKYIGVFQSYEEIYNSPSQITLDGNTEVLPGDCKYLDFNNDGKIDKNDAFRHLYGIVPEIQYGVTLGGRWKNFDFSVLFQGSAHASFQKNWDIMWHFSNNDNVFDKHWYWFTPEIAGDEKYIRLYKKTWLNNEPSGGTNSYSMGNGDYLRLKNLELGYTLPNKWTNKIFMNNLRVYFTANNLVTWAAEPYLDPDNRDNRGGVMPQTRAFNFGLNVNF